MGQYIDIARVCIVNQCPLRNKVCYRQYRYNHLTFYIHTCYDKKISAQIVTIDNLYILNFLVFLFWYIVLLVIPQNIKIKSYYSSFIFYSSYHE